MSLVNFTTREITCKIVYYGPGRSGKTTNLQYIYGRVPEARRGRMVVRLRGTSVAGAWRIYRRRIRSS